MKTPDPELAFLLQHGRSHRQVAAGVRGRLLSRARALASATENSSEPSVARRAPFRRRGLSLAAAASLCLGAVSVSAAAAALWSYRFDPRESIPSAHPNVVPQIRVSSTVTERLAPVAPRDTPAPTASKPARPPVDRDSYAAEIRLLRRAQSAYAGSDYSSSLAVLAEHVRRFPKGGLAEEREALRVRSLAALGRTVQARRAAASFAERFPRSALLPRVRESLEAADSRD